MQVIRCAGMSGQSWAGGVGRGHGVRLQAAASELGDLTVRCGEAPEDRGMARPGGELLKGQSSEAKGEERQEGWGEKEGGAGVW